MIRSAGSPIGATPPSTWNSPAKGDAVMAKSMDRKKETKKKATKTLKEKRLEKKNKKTSRTTS
jgi:hypothetical protein